MKWFGNPGGAPYEADSEHIDTPVGEHCQWCEEAIVAEDDGVTIDTYREGVGWRDSPMHYECHLRSLIGGLNHLRGRCTCCGGDQPPDPPELTRRQAAIQAVRLWGMRR